MKKILSVLAVAVIMVACESKTTPETTVDTVRVDTTFTDSVSVDSTKDSVPVADSLK